MSRCSAKLAGVLLVAALVTAGCGVDPLEVSEAGTVETGSGGILSASGETGRIAYGGGNPNVSIEEALSVNMTTVDGSAIDVSQFLGQDVVLWFWAPWCAWCNAEAARLDTVASEFEGQVEVVGVAGASDRTSMMEFVDRHELGHLTHLADLDGHFWTTLDVSYQPWWMFINEDREVVSNWQGRLDESQIRELMTRLVEL